MFFDATPFLHVVLTFVHKNGVDPTLFCRPYTFLERKNVVGMGIFEIELTFIEKATDKFGYWYIKFRGEGDNWRKAKEDCNRHHFWWNPDKKAWRVSEEWLCSDD